MTLVDSDVLIAHLRGVPEARDYLVAARQRGRLHASVVTVTEITGGMRSHERRDVWRLLGGFDLEPVGYRTAVRAGELMRQFRQSHASIGLGDYLIAATADVLGLELGTLNTKHFPMFPGLSSAFRLAPESSLDVADRAADPPDDDHSDETTN